jgi:hypothetical protein
MVRQRLKKHTVLSAQTVPHVPQFLSSLVVSTHCAVVLTTQADRLTAEQLSQNGTDCECTMLLRVVTSRTNPGCTFIAQGPTLLVHLSTTSDVLRTRVGVPWPVISSGEKTTCCSLPMETKIPRTRVGVTDVSKVEGSSTTG